MDGIGYQKMNIYSNGIVPSPTCLYANYRLGYYKSLYEYSYN
jgi:hypothetical protein